MPTTYLEAIREGMMEEMERDPAVFLLGEDIGVYGGAFKVTAGMLDRFGEQRVVDTPISESAIVGAAIGASFAGLPGASYVCFAIADTGTGGRTYRPTCERGWPGTGRGS